MTVNKPKFLYLVKKQPFYLKFLKIVIFYYCKFVFYFYTPLKVYNKKYIPNSSFILCSNHNSHMDVAILSASTNKSFNHLAYSLKKKFIILGSAHSLQELNIKKLQAVEFFFIWVFISNCNK